MSRSSVSNILRGSVKASFVAGALLLGLTVSSAQAAIVTVFSDNLAGWQAAAGSPGISETFGTDVANPPNASAAVSFGTITFGDSAFPGRIAGGVYSDRADTAAGIQPLLTFSGPGVLAFGADWDLGPNDPGTGLALFVTFADLSTQLLATEIPNGFGNPATFFGIVSDMAILSIRLLEGTQGAPTANFETFDMTNVRVSAVPIPAALPLFLSALAALGFLGRRRKQMAAAA